MKRANTFPLHNSPPLVSIITINYNRLILTLDFLSSIAELTYANTEVIVVDNASLEDPSAEIQLQFPQVKVVRSERNLGFSGGNNLGVRHAEGQFFLFINNDTLVTPTLIEELLIPFEQDPSIGLVSPKILFASRRTIIQYAGSTSVNPITGRNKTIGSHKKDQGQFDIPGDTAYAFGTAMMTSRKLFEEVGPMPEIYFLYYEELDWSCMFKRAGYRIYFQPSAIVYHIAYGAVGSNSTLYTYYILRNRILFMRRNIRGWRLWIFYFYTAFVILPKKVTYLLIPGLMRRRWSHLGAMVRAISWHFSHSSSKIKS